MEQFSPAPSENGQRRGPARRQTVYNFGIPVDFRSRGVDPGIKRIIELDTAEILHITSQTLLLSNFKMCIGC